MLPSSHSDGKKASGLLKAEGRRRDREPPPADLPIGATTESRDPPADSEGGLSIWRSHQYQWQSLISPHESTIRQKQWSSGLYEKTCCMNSEYNQKMSVLSLQSITIDS